MYRINKDCSEFFRFTKAGFYVDFEECIGNILRCVITCVCGRKEVISIVVTNELMKEYVYMDKVNLVKLLIANGTFGYEHLIKDGYCPDDALNIVRILRGDK